MVVAVVAGAGNQQLFRDLGCHAIVDGGQSMNPSAAQLLKAVEELGVDEVVILPNNGNVILTAEQAAGMSSLHIAVVPSRSIPSGLAAMVAFDPGEDAVGNARLMQDAIVDVRYAEVTHAVRDSELDGLEVKQGQAMAIVDGRLVAAADDIVSAFGGVLEEFARGGADYVTVLTALNGSGTTREQLEELGRARRARRRGQLPRRRTAVVPDPCERGMNAVGDSSSGAPQVRPTMNTSGCSRSRTRPSSSTPRATRRTGSSTVPASTWSRSRSTSATRCSATAST